MIAAHVTVFQCDECAALVSIKSDAEWEEFERTWHTGLFNDFCPRCRVKSQTRTRVIRDEYARLSLRNAGEREFQNDLVN